MVHVICILHRYIRPAFRARDGAEKLAGAAGRVVPLDGDAHALCLAAFRHAVAHKQGAELSLVPLVWLTLHAK